MAIRITRTNIFTDVEVSGVSVVDGKMVMDEKPRTFRVPGKNPTEDEIRQSVMTSTHGTYTPILIGARSVRGQLRAMTMEKWLQESSVVRELTDEEMCSLLAKDGE